MSRQNPKWARTANYPAGGHAWSGQPTTSTPGSDIVTPDTLLPAEEYNAVLRSVALEGIQAGQRVAVASPWSVLDMASNSLVLLDLRWSPANECWLALVDSGTTDIKLVKKAGSGPTLSQFQTFRNNISPPNTATHIWAFPTAVLVLSDAGTFTRTTSGGVTHPAGVAGSHWDDIQGLGNSTASAFLVAHSGTNTLIFKTTNSGSSTSVVSVPATFSTYLGGWSSSDTSGTATVFAPKGSGAQTKALRCDASGATAVPSAGATGAVCGVCYDEETSKWFLFSVSGTDTLVYSSSDDAVTFALVASISSVTVDSVVSAAGVIMVKGTSVSALASDTSATQFFTRYAMTDDIEKWFVCPSGIFGSGDNVLVEGGGQSFAMKSSLEVLFSGNVGLSQTDG